MTEKPPTREEIAAQLALFDQDARAAMNRQPEKLVLQDPGGPVLEPFAGLVQNGAFVQRRDLVRQKTCGERNGQLIRLDQIEPGRAPYLSNDLVQDLVDVPGPQILRTLEAMEGRGLLSARLRQAPWSSTYWPTHQGQLGARYADPGFPGSKDWQENRSYIEQNPAADIVASGNQAAIDNLSPAEKYDLLAGNDHFTLTEANWDAGRRVYEQTGSVESWVGICHGWSPAAFMLPRPVQVVTFLAANGTTVLNFYPDDVKALGCLLWANTRPITRFVGGRCTDKDPQTDPQSGRTLSQSCFDTNPGTWHMAVVNQIGIANRAFVIDATFDYEVWNQPVLGYSYSYFNPQTRQPADSLQAARVDRGSFTSDKFARWRSEQARYMTGVSMTLSYIAETAPSHATSDSSSRDRIVQVNYLYDLEQDEAGNILGGEWYLNRHPDFMWTPPPKGQALSSQDGALAGIWSGGPLPPGWRQAATAAAADGQPLARLVNILFQVAG